MLSNRKLIFDNQYVSIWHYSYLKMVHHRFKSHPGEEELKKILSIGSELFRKENCNRWLSDDTHLRSVSKGMKEWALKNWFPPLLESSWKHWAIVLPENYMGKYELTKAIVTSKQQLPLIIELFKDEESALEWLSSVK